MIQTYHVSTGIDEGYWDFATITCLHADGRITTNVITNLHLLYRILNALTLRGAWRLW